MGKITIPLILLLFFATLSAEAAYYFYKDAEGQTYITNDPEQIPEAYRDRAESYETVEELQEAQTPISAKISRKKSEIKVRFDQAEEKIKGWLNAITAKVPRWFTSIINFNNALTWIWIALGLSTATIICVRILVPEKRYRKILNFLILSCIYLLCSAMFMRSKIQEKDSVMEQVEQLGKVSQERNKVLEELK